MCAGFCVDMFLFLSVDTYRVLQGRVVTVILGGTADY